MHFISSRLSLLFDGCLAGWFRTVWWVHLETNGKTELLPVQTVIVDAQQHSLIFIMLLFSARYTSTRKLSHVKTNMPWTVAMSHPVGTACLANKTVGFFQNEARQMASSLETSDSISCNISRVFLSISHKSSAFGESCRLFPRSSNSRLGSERCIEHA